MNRGENDGVSQSWADNETLQSYSLVKVLSHGRSGSVVIAKDPNGHEIVVKSMGKKTTKQHWVENEVKAGALLRRKNLVRFREHKEDALNHYVMLDVVKGEDLWHFMCKRHWKPLTEREASKVFKGVLKSVEYCHEMGVAHKDVKLENVMIDFKQRTTLIDFGFCEFSFFTKLSHRFDGTLDYMPPEMLQRHPFNPFKADVFALGVLLFILLTGSFPFELEHRCKMISKGMAPFVDWTSTPPLSASVKLLVEGMLHPSQEKRMALSGVLRHPWIKPHSRFYNFWQVLPK